MITQNIILKNKEGLHARPATEIAKSALKYGCDIKFDVKGIEYDAKSVLNIMSAGIRDNTQIKIICNGADEKQALTDILEVFKSNSLL